MLFFLVLSWIGTGGDMGMTGGCNKWVMAFFGIKGRDQAVNNEEDTRNARGLECVEEL